MRILATSIILNLLFTLTIFGADFRNLNWGMSQEEVIALNGQPVEKTENKVVGGTKTQTMRYKDNIDNYTYELLFLEDLLINASYKISTEQNLSANDVGIKFSELTKELVEKYDEPYSVEKIDNSAKKIIYDAGNTKIMIIYYNIPIKEDYVNRNAYLSVSYSNTDIVLKAKMNNRRADRRRGIGSN